MELFCLSKLEKNSAEDFGGKGNGLKKLLEMGALVPVTHGLTREKWRNFSSPEQLLSNLSLEGFSFPLIVRSSANIEDQAGFSFAGVFKSVRANSPLELKAAILEVMDSILAPTSRDLFESLGVDQKDVFPGFLIQPFVDTRQRGVAFSRNPQNLWDQDACIEVSTTGSVVDGENDTSLVFETKNTDSVYREVFTLCHQLENKYLSPADIEWGETKNGELILFQFRPIAGATAEGVRRHLRNPNVVWSRELAQERFPECLTPMGFDVIADGIPTNLKALYEYFGIKTGDASQLVYSDEGWVYNSDRFFKFPGGVKIDFFQFLKKRPSFFLSVLIKSFRTGNFGLSVSEAFVDPIQEQAKKEFALGLKNIFVLRSELEFFSTATFSKDEIARRMKRINEVAQSFLKTDFVIFIGKETLFKTYQKCWKSEKQEMSFLNLISMLPKNISMTQMSNPEELQYARTSWDVFCPSVADQVSNLQTQSSEPVKKSPIGLSLLWEKRVQKLQQWMVWDEELHHYTGVLIEASRRVLLTTGNLMVKEGVLENRDQIFFLHLEEVKQYLNGSKANFSARAQLRQKRFLNRKDEQPLPILPPKLEPLPEKLQTILIPNQFAGIGMTKGEAIAKFLFLNHFSEITELPNEPFILITQAPNPAWISLFPKIVGWITETGGPLAHGFVAARDYGIPAVSKVNLPTLLATGKNKRIRINGETGIVEVIS